MLTFAGTLRGPRFPLATMNQTRKTYTALGLLSLVVVGAIGIHTILRPDQDMGRGLTANHVVEAGESETVQLGSPVPQPIIAERRVEGENVERIRLNIQPGAQLTGPPTDPHRSASLDVQITSLQAGTLTTIEVLGGANAGWTGQTGADGTLRVEQLEPGCMNVRVQTAKGETCERLVQVRRNSQLKLNFGPATPHRLHVQDHEGQPLIPDWIWVEGQTWTPRDSIIAVTPATTEQVPFRLGKAGYATMGGLLDGSDAGPRTLVLKPACALQVAVTAPTHLRGLARVQVVPLHSETQLFGLEGTDFGLVHLPQSSIDFPDLPQGRVRVIITHPSGVARSVPIKLVPNETRRVTMQIEAGQRIQGQITRGGIPYSNAIATFHPTQGTRIKHKAFRGSAQALLSVPVECLAGTPLRVHTDATGVFSMTLPPFDVAHEGRFHISGPEGYGNDCWVEWSASGQSDLQRLRIDAGSN